MPSKQTIFTPSFFAVVLFSLAFLMLGSQMVAYEGISYSDEESYTATVTEILDHQTEVGMDGYQMETIVFVAMLTSGDLKGQAVDVIQTIDEMFFPIPEAVEEGDAILLLAPTAEYDGWTYAGDNHISVLIGLIGLFLLMILVIGRGKGVATVLSLLFTMGAIFYIYVPAILNGMNVYRLTIIVTAFIIFSSLILLNGLNVKTFCAIVGNLGGVLVAGLLAMIVNSAMSITGVVDQDYVFLTILTDSVSIDLQAVVWGGVLIGSLGAIMDVAMTIASAMEEVGAEMEEKSFRRLVSAGMRIGQDAIGTMTNTLILAYVGSSLAVVLLFAAYNKDLLILLNLEMISIEIIQAVVGSMGILVAVPLTVCFSAFLATRRGGGVARPQ